MKCDFPWNFFIECTTVAHAGTDWYLPGENAPRVVQFRKQEWSSLYCNFSAYASRDSRPTVFNISLVAFWSFVRWKVLNSTLSFVLKWFFSLLYKKRLFEHWIYVTNEVWLRPCNFHRRYGRPDWRQSSVTLLPGSAPTATLLLNMSLNQVASSRVISILRQTTINFIGQSALLPSRHSYEEIGRVV